MLDLAVAYPDGPGDVRVLDAWLGGLAGRAVSRIAIFGKTEGPATLNDYSRDWAQVATDAALERHGLLPKAIRLFSTGCEGIASPVTIMMASTGDDARSGPDGLVFGAAHSHALPAYPRCGADHIAVAADTVRAAMAEAGLTPEQTALVLIKSPVLIPGRFLPGSPLARHAGSTGSSRGAAALGAGVALGEVDGASIGDDPVGRTPAFARRVMSFSGTEADRIEAMVLGARPGGDPRYCIATNVLDDFLDRAAIDTLKAEAGASPELVLFKAGIAADGRLRGRRTTVLTSDLTPDKQLRAAASGFIAAHFGAAAAFISGGAEHQAAPGGCVCAVISRSPVSSQENRP